MLLLLLLPPPLLRSDKLRFAKLSNSCSFTKQSAANPLLASPKQPGISSLSFDTNRPLTLDTSAIRPQVSLASLRLVLEMQVEVVVVVVPLLLLLVVVPACVQLINSPF